MTELAPRIILARMKTRVTDKGAVVLPRKVLQQQKVRVGDNLEVIADVDEPGVIVLRRISKRPNEGLADWLRACPVKGIRIPKRSKEMPREVDL